MRETFWHITIIFFVTGMVFFINLGEARLWDRDEPRNAGCAEEMMARGDWIVPTFNDELRHQKPVLLYWFIISAYSVFGVNEFAARFWSAALAVGATFATYAIARRVFSSTVALYAAIALATSLMFDVAARAATPDSVLAFFTTSALAVYVTGTFARSANGLQLKNAGHWFPQKFIYVFAFYVLLALAVLAKGPVGFLLPMAMIGLFLLIQTAAETVSDSTSKNQKGLVQNFKTAIVAIGNVVNPFHFLKTLWSMRPLMAIVVVLAVAAPWYLLVDARTEGEFTRQFFVGEHFGRATTSLENHSGGLWFYPVAILFGFFPWSIFWWPVVLNLFRRRPDSTSQSSPAVARLESSGTCLMLCWIGIQVVAFSLVQTKLPSYVTPCYPALAILTAGYMVGFAQQRTHVGRGWFITALIAFALTGLTMTIGIGIATNGFLPNQFWLAGLGLVPLIGGTVLLWMTLTNRTQRIPAVFGAAALVLCVGMFGFGTVSLDSEQQSHRLLAELDADCPVASYGCLESSWVYYAGRPIYEIATDDSHTGQFEARKFWQRKPQPSLESFIAWDNDAVVITTAEKLVDIKKTAA